MKSWTYGDYMSLHGNSSSQSSSGRVKIASLISNDALLDRFAAAVAATEPLREYRERSLRRESLASSSSSSGTSMVHKQPLDLLETSTVMISNKTIMVLMTSLLSLCLGHRSYEPNQIHVDEGETQHII